MVKWSLLMDYGDAQYGIKFISQYIVISGGNDVYHKMICIKLTIDMKLHTNWVECIYLYVLKFVFVHFICT